MRYYYRRKATVEESFDLTVQQLKRYGMLESGYTAMPIEWVTNHTGKRTRILIAVDISTDDPFVILMYTLTDRDGNKTDYKREVSLLKTPCNFGGIRYWFACPVCFKRVGNLYRPPDNIYFCCRGCQNLSYNSRNEPHSVRHGGLYYPLKLDGQIEKLYDKIKRWSYKGRPTRKVRKLRVLEQRMEQGFSVSNMLLKRQGIGGNK